MGQLADGRHPWPDLGALILGEPLPPSLLLAMTLVLIGVGLGQYGALRRLFGR